MYLQKDFLFWGRNFHGKPVEKKKAVGEALTIPPRTTHLIFLDTGRGDGTISRAMLCKLRT